MPFTGSTLAVTLARNGNTVGSVAGRSWPIEFLFDVEVQDFTTDVMAAGTYTLALDGVDVAGAVVGGATNNVVFTPFTTLVVPAGVHTWTLYRQTGTSQFYRYSGSASGPLLTGTGRDYLGKWDLIPTTSDYMAGTFNFKSLDGGLVATVHQNQVSSGTFAAQTGNHVFSSDVELVAVRTQTRDADTYDLKVNGNIEATVGPTVGTSGEDYVFRPSTPVALAAGAHAIAIDPQGASRRFPYRSGTGTSETGDGASHISAWGVWAESTGNQPQRTLAFMLDLDIPGPVENLTITALDHESATAEWDAPSTGDTPAGYEYQLDGGGWVDNGTALTVELTGLDPETLYSLEVRAYGADGESAPETVGFTTDAAPVTPVGGYRVVLTVGPYEWDVLSTDPAGFGPRLPLSLGWVIPDAVEFFPAQADPTTMVFQVLVETPDDLEDAARGSAVTFAMYVDGGATPWQEFQGIITQLDGVHVPGQGFLATVYAADDTMRLADMVVGYTGDWPIESIGDRLERICDEAGLTLVPVLLGTGREGWLSARTAKPTDVLSAIRDTVKDLAFESSGPVYGRPVISYDPAELEVRLMSFDRKLFPDATVTLDGSYVYANGSWSKRPGRDAAEWVLVDGTTFGTPSGPPLIRSTSLLDYTGDPPGSDTNYSAFTRDNLGEALLAGGSTMLAGWYHTSLRYAAKDAPDLVEGWASFAPLTFVIPVVIVDLDDRYDLNATDYLAGTLTGARLVIPPGGDYYLELRLRPELLDGTELP